MPGRVLVRGKEKRLVFFVHRLLACLLDPFMLLLEGNVLRVPLLSPSARAILSASRATGSVSTPRYSQSGPRRTYAPVYQRMPAERSLNGRWGGDLSTILHKEPARL